MNPKAIIAIAEASAILIKTLVPLIEDGVEVFTVDEDAQLKSALDQIHNANEVIYSRVQSKLRTAPI